MATEDDWIIYFAETPALHYLRKRHPLGQLSRSWPGGIATVFAYQPLTLVYWQLKLSLSRC